MTMIFKNKKRDLQQLHSNIVVILQDQQETGQHQVLTNCLERTGAVMNNSSCYKIAFISDQSWFEIVNNLVAKCNLTNIF